MTHKKKLALAVVALGVLGSCSDTYPTISTLGFIKEFFGATLTGEAERPTPVTTSASGRSNITILDTNTVRVETIVSTIDSVTQAHIHHGDANTAGPIRVFLLSNVAAGRAPITGTDRVLSLVQINRNAPTCGTSGIPTPCFQGGTGAWTMDSLLFHIRNGTAYVNVHTRRNPAGEIRGQIAPQ